MEEKFKKACSRCKESYPITREFFAKHQRVCKFCAESALKQFPDTAKLYCPQGHQYDAYSITHPTESTPYITRKCQVCNKLAKQEYRRIHSTAPTPEQLEKLRVYRREHRASPEYMLQYREENKAKLKLQKSANYQQHRAERLEKTRQKGFEAKKKVYAHYGNVCVCCGLADLAFLTLDHKNNDGAKHRKAVGIQCGVNMCMWIIRNNFPDMFQILCWNCNAGKQYSKSGMCPHEEARQAA